jgi:hypothetical protein
MNERQKLTIEGLTPLLLHNPAGSMFVAAGASKGRKIPTPEDEAEKATYRLENGTLAIPAIAIRNCLVSASGAYKRGRYNLRTFLSHIMVEPELVPLLSSAGKPIKDYEIDIRRAVVNKSGIMRARPKITIWQASFEVIYDPEMLANEDAEALFAKILTDGGSRIGIGDYRPEKKGWFGRFQVV